MGHWEEKNDDTWFYDENEMVQHAIGNYGTSYDFHDWIQNTYNLDDLLEKAVGYNDVGELWNDLSAEFEDSLLQEAGHAVEGKDYCIYDVNFIWVDDDEDEE